MSRRFLVFGTFIGVILIALLWTLLSQLSEKETSVVRIQREKVIHCGYIPYEPFIIKDPNTKQLSGVVIDYVNSVAAFSDLRVDWREVNIDQAVTALNARHIDAYCIPMMPDENWLKVAAFSVPFGALPYYVYVPDKSTARSFSDLQTVQFVTVDGFSMSDVTRRFFPKARYLGLPQTASPAEMYDQLRYGKADAIINESVSADNYVRHNPNTIHRLMETPLVALRTFMNTRKGDEAMADFMQTRFSALLPANETILKNLLEQYAVPQGGYLLESQCDNVCVYKM